MRAALIGAGSLGTIIGALMTQGGRPIDLIDTNAEHVAALNRDGARITGELELVVPVKALTPQEMTGHYDLVFLLNKQTANDAVINITTGGSTRMTLEERLAYPLQLQPEMCSLNMGSMNFSIHPVAQKITQWRYPWEQSYIAGMEDLIHVEGFRQKYNDDLTWLQAYSAVALLANAIKESGSTEPKDVALAMEDMELESINGTVKMRASDHQLQQPLSVATWSKINDTNVQIEQEGTGFGWRTDEVIPAADSERATTCKMKRPT